MNKSLKRGCERARQFAGRGVLLIPALLVMVVSCHGTPPSDYDPVPVLAVVLDSLKSEFRGTERVPVLERTASVYADERDFNSIDAHPREVRAFQAANSKETLWPDSVAGRLGLDFIDVLEIPYDGNSWDSVSDELGFGAYVVFLSHPGFSTDGSSAVVAYSFSCGSLCGEGHVARLERRDEGWVIVDDHMYLIS